MTIKKTLEVLVLAVVMATLIAFTGTKSSVSAQGEVAPELEGSWEVTVGQDPTLNLATFDRGGGMVVVNPNKHVSTGHGNWVKTGPHQYTVTFVFILRNPAGEIDLGTVKIRSVFQLDPVTDTFTGPEQVIVTIGGTVVDSFCAIVQGKRISVEPPECS